MPQVEIAASMMCADFSRLAEQTAQLEKAGVDRFHFDIMDGHFVPNITFGPSLMLPLRPLTSLPFDAHLMVEHPERFVEATAQAGADTITVHVEAAPHLHRVVRQIKEAGAKAGVSLNPATPAAALAAIAEELDLVLVMSVNPGWAGQAFIPSSVQKVAAIRELLSAHGSAAHIQIDGGIKKHNAAQVVQAGARVLVVGSSLFDSAHGFLPVIEGVRQAVSG
jgi:ribulose-phosphate 3-epimerase